MSGIVWPPRWACRFGSQAWWIVARCCQMLSVGTQSLTQIDADIMTLDSYMRPGYLLEMGGFLMKFESALFMIAIWDWRFLNLCNNFATFCVRCVLCWNQTISVSFETGNNLARRSIRTIRIPWFLRNNLKGHQIKWHLRPTLESNTRLVNSLSPGAVNLMTSRLENCSGWWYKVRAWNLLLV